MAKYILETAGNINWMAIFALFTFMFVFVTACILIFTNRQHYFDKMSNLPLEEDNYIDESIKR